MSRRNGNNRLTDAVGVGLMASSFLFLCSCGVQKGGTDGTQMEFLRATAEALQLELSNHSNAIVSFRGSLDGSEVAHPWDTLVECKSPDSEFWDEAPFVLVDGGPDTVDVAPGHSVRVDVGAKFVAGYKGGLCHVRLRLKGGSFITSNDFRP